MRRRSWKLFLFVLLLAAIAILVFAPSLDDGLSEAGVDAAGDGERAELVVPAVEAPPAAPSSTSAPAPAEPDSKRVQVTPLEDRPENRQAGRATRISGRVVDRYGKPSAAALVIAAPWPTDESLAELREAGGAPLDRARLSHLPLDLAGAADLGLDVRHQVRTDTKGEFVLTTLPPGRFRLALRAHGQAPWDRNDLLLAAGDELELGSLSVAPGIVLSGTVRDDDGPVAGALLTRIDDLGDPALAGLGPALAARLATCDTHGRFFTAALTPGRWRLLVTAPGRVEQVVEGEGLDERLAIRLERGARLRGDVVADKADLPRLSVWTVPASAESSPLAVAARADARSAVLQPSGGFTIESLHADRVYDMRVVSPTQRFEAESPWSPRRIAAADTRSRGARHRLGYRADASLVFDLRAPGGLASISRLEVVISGATPERSQFDDPAALLRIAGVRPLAGVLRGRDSAHVSVLAPGFARYEQDVALSPGLESGLGTLTLEPLSEVQVAVSDAASGRALAGAEVRAVEGLAWREAHLGRTSAHSDQDGIARVTSFGSRDSSIVVRSAGRATLRLAGPFAAPGASLEARMEPGVEVRVRTVDLPGHPLKGVLVEHVEGEWTPNDGLSGDRARLRPGQGPSTTAISDRDGACVFRGLARGIHVFRIARARRASDSEWSLIEVGRDRHVDVLLATEAHAELEVHVGVGGEPLARARATLIPAPAALEPRAFLEAGEPLFEGVDARTDDDGWLAIANLLPGVHHLVVEVPDQGVRALRSIRIGVGENRLRLDLGGDLQTIAGRVIDPAGAPVAGVDLFLISDGDERALFAVADDRTMPDVFEAFAQRFPGTTRSPATRTDGEGLFRIVGIAREPGLGLFAMDGQGGRARFASVGDLGDGTPLEIALEPGGALLVRIVDARPGLRYRVAAAPLEARTTPRIARTLADLPVTFNALAPGDWSVRLWTEDSQGRAVAVGRAETVTITAGETTMIERTLR